MMPSSEQQKPKRLFIKHIVSKIFLEDWPTKLVALAITFALWLGVTGLSTPTARRMSDIPLTLSYSNNTEITNSPIQNVSIVVSGDRRKINQLSETGLVVSLDLSDVAPGDRVVQLTPENVMIDLPLGVKLQEILPNKIAVRLEAVEEKDVAVKIETQGEVPDGFEIYGETVTPHKVRVRAPAAYLRTLNSIPTDKIDLRNRQTDFTARQIAVSLSNPKATALEPAVDVTFRIGEKRVERTFHVPVGNAAGKKATIMLFGGKSIINSLKPEDIRIEQRKEASGNESLKVQLPDALTDKIEVRKTRSNF